MQATFSCGVNILSELICGLWDANTSTCKHVKNIVLQIKITDLQHPKAHIMEAVGSATPNMIHAMWNEADYHLDMCHATQVIYTKIHCDFFFFYY